MGATASQIDGKYQSSFGTFYDLKANDIDGNEKSMSDFRGKVLMVVNVASSCGKTDREYKRLVDLYSRYHDQDFEILAFPCNQFLYQEHGSCTTIKTFIKKYNVEFPMFDKINVNGNDTHPIYAWLKQSYPGRVKWNFSGKFLIDHHGIPRARANDNYEEIEQIIQRLLKEKKDDENKN
ncbi:unnamed protein product [Rotaria sp. Silwood2]|nr:unnamed protein product [Rotaria sp. Silwood2]CAF2687121.1 unnamed protein product [Rotaria sp. Silwood2]CAF2975830.1 unnamed protein product [Rotaria sp. Silwood2]CAF4194471.1 unnamed protein product [Rotaria sp. Silwood2]CAF4305667.1 unnamed protein product [Rotaria sp. Silwood2]